MVSRAVIGWRKKSSGYITAKKFTVRAEKSEDGDTIAIEDHSHGVSYIVPLADILAVIEEERKND